LKRSGSDASGSRKLGFVLGARVGVAAAKGMPRVLEMACRFRRALPRASLASLTK
jgi:hypothetical protein